MNKTKDQIIQTVLSESNHLSENVIKKLLLKFGEMHNISPEYNFFEAKQEVVSDVGYFPGPKKKYALHIVNKEGVDVDKRDDKGLIVRRSDYPQFTKDSINEVLKMIVETETISFSKIREYIDEIRNKMVELISVGSKEIARPVSFTKPLREYKTMPMHIKGMLMFNSIEYNYFEPGTKGYMYRILGVDLDLAPDKIRDVLPSSTIENNIVIPYEEASLPDYYIIDKEAILNFAWNDRVDEIIEPIKNKLGYEVPVENLAILW